MGMSTRGPLPLLIYSGGVGLQGKYPIWYYTISYCSLTVHADQCRAPHALILWAVPPLTMQPMSYPVGIWGYTPTLSPLNGSLLFLSFGFIVLWVV